MQASQDVRLDQLLARTWDDLTHDGIRALINQDAVLINGEPALKPGQRLAEGDEVTVDRAVLAEARAAGASEDEAFAAPPGLAVSVLYEDDALLIVDKPAGLPVRRSRRTDDVTLPQVLAGMYPDHAHVGGVNRAGVVTTLGEEVSGPVLAGRNEDAYRELRRLLKRQYVVEIYSALVDGQLRGEYTIDQPIGNAKHTRGRLMVAREGREARTHVRPQQHYKDGGREYTLVELRPESSRMHQMRVHLAWYGFPVVGDRLYGTKRQAILPDRLFLHLSRVTLPHPETGDQLRVDSPLPAELHSILSYMRRPK
jgi:23S rRNA pseudouridine1911/1915/1917 synthase